MATVKSEGPIETKQSRDEALAARMCEELVEHGPMKTGDLAKALGEDPTSGTWKRARTSAKEDGYIEPVEGQYGVYRATERQEPTI